MNRITLNGRSKEDVRKAVEEQSDANIKAQTMDDKGKESALKIIDALPEGILSGTIEDHNNGTVTINVTSRTDFAATVAAANVTGSSQPQKGMPGAGAAGRPELTPSGGKGDTQTAKQ